MKPDPKDGLPVVLCHGFPELAYSWRYQLPALAAAGYPRYRARSARLWPQHRARPTFETTTWRI